MKYSETIASTCRYGDVAERIFGEAEILWEHSEDDWSGNANLFAKMPDGQFCHYEWTYGSCCGCDDWEDRGLSDDAVEAEMRRSAAWLKDLETARRYLRLEGEFAQVSSPSAQSPVAGGMAGMMRQLSGEVGTDFLAMRDAFETWCNASLGVSTG
jgi:hypothetical protein